MQISSWLESARKVVPVLTAHPTEVQRQSILDCERGIAAALLKLEDARLSERQRQRIEARLHARALTLWQTAMIRLARLRVIDEIENALRSTAGTFSALIQRMHEEMEPPCSAASRCWCCCAWDPGSAAVTATAIRSTRWRRRCAQR